MNRIFLLLIISVLLPSLAACGGAGGVNSTPALASNLAPPQSPVPPAPPPPAAPPFVPVTATIFSEPLYNPALAVAGQGYQYDYVPNTAGLINLRNENSFAVSYDSATQSYRVNLPIAGAGTLMRVGDYRNADGPFQSSFAANNTVTAPGAYPAPTMTVSSADRPDSIYRYVSLVDFYTDASLAPNLHTVAYGTFAIGQPTRLSEIPMSGTAQYNGDLFGHLAGDAGATWLTGTTRFDFDFGSAVLTGQLTAQMQCMMGCSYAPVGYAFANTNITRSANSFGGELLTPGAPSAGSFLGFFAGPKASELAARFEMPFFSLETGRWTPSAGAIVARRQ